MGKLTLILLSVLLLSACAEERVVTKFIKLEITDPGLPMKPEICAKPNYVLLEYKGQAMVAESVSEKLNRLECDSDKVRYTKELISTINYYREAVK